MLKLKFKNREKLIITITVAIFLYTITFFHSSKKIEVVKVEISGNVCTKCQEILRFFRDRNIFLTDGDKLKEISMFKNATNLEINFFKYFRANQILSFGVFYADLLNIVIVYS
jgi:hypothetical protein